MFCESKSCDLILLSLIFIKKNQILIILLNFVLT